MTETNEDFPIVCGDGWRITRFLGTDEAGHRVGKIYASLILDEVRQIDDLELCSFSGEGMDAEWHRTFYLLQAFARFANAQGDPRCVPGLGNLMELFDVHKFVVDWPLLVTTQEVEEALYVYASPDDQQRLIIIEDTHQELMSAAEFLDEIGVLSECDSGLVAEEGNDGGPGPVSSGGGAAVYEETEAVN